MTFLDHPKNFERWIAAVQSDYELVLSQFLVQDSWTFQTFKDCVNKCHTIMLHHSAVGKGKPTNEHFQLVTDILLRKAKDFWLKDPMTKVIEALENDEELCHAKESLSSVKRMLGGFYLLYTMYKTIPFKDPDALYKIQLDARDMVCFYYFRLVLVEKGEIPLFVKKHFLFLFGSLHLDGAFEIVVESEKKGVDNLTRIYENNKTSTIAKLNNEHLTAKVELIGPDLHMFQKKDEQLQDLKAVVCKKTMTSSSGLSNCIMNSSPLDSHNFPGHERSNQDLKMDLGIPLASIANSQHETASTSQSGLPGMFNAVALTHLIFEKPVWTVNSSLATRTGGREMVAEATERLSGNNMIGPRRTDDEEDLEEAPSYWREHENSAENKKSKTEDCPELWSYIKNGKYGAYSATNSKE